MYIFQRSELSRTHTQRNLPSTLASVSGYKQGTGGALNLGQSEECLFTKGTNYKGVGGL